MTQLITTLDALLGTSSGPGQWTESARTTLPEFSRRLQTARLSAGQESRVLDHLSEIERAHPEDVAVQAAQSMVRTLTIGKAAPEISGKDLDDAAFRLSDYRGKVVLIDFWGIWCPACVSSVKQLVDGYRRMHGKGFEILSVHSGGRETEVRKFASEHEMTWPQTIETGEISAGRPLQRLYRFFGAPNYFLVDRDGSLLTNDVRKPEVLLAEVEKRLGVTR